MVCCRQRLYSLGLRFFVKWPGAQAKHKVGSGSVFVVDTNTALTGTLGEGPARFLRGSCFSRGFFWG